jgi:predicted small secreted protein
MKKYSMLMVVLVLTGCLLTGCGCTRQGAGLDTMPATEMTILPTNIPETTAPIIPSTQPMTQPATEPTMDTETAGTDNGASEDITGGTGETGTRSRIR